MLELDGSHGEGGGQVLRTALSLSLVTGQPFRLINVRAGREKPGLRPQHLAAVRAAAQVGRARTSEVAVGSRTLEFTPGALQAGAQTVDVGTAGSATLVLQTVLLPLIHAGLDAALTVRGGTHNPKAPSADFLQRAYLPLLRRAGADAALTIVRRGFYPAGGGELQCALRPGARLTPFELLDTGPREAPSAEAIVSALPSAIAARELDVVQRRLGWPKGTLHAVEEPSPSGPGNAVVLTVPSAHVTEVFTAIGERGVRAEAVAHQAADEAEAYLRVGAPVGPHLADQLLLVLALAGGGAFVSSAPTLHARTQVDVLQRFLPVDVELTEQRGGRVRFALRRRAQVV